MADVLQTDYCEDAADSTGRPEITQKALPEVGQQLQVYACHGNVGNCCIFRPRTVTELNCLGYFVYFLNPTTAGVDARYCATTEY